MIEELWLGDETPEKETALNDDDYLGGISGPLQCKIPVPLVKNYVDSALSISSHIEDSENPHSVSKDQVGLENVPNVTTNNQTPTYSESSSLALLTSGEVLSTAFGKLKKAVSSLISHLVNVSNPHRVTRGQLNIDTSDEVSFGIVNTPKVNTGNGDVECYGMNQHALTSSSVRFAHVDSDGWTTL